MQILATNFVLWVPFGVGELRENYNLVEDLTDLHSLILEARKTPFTWLNVSIRTFNGTASDKLLALWIST